MRPLPPGNDEEHAVGLDAVHLAHDHLAHLGARGLGLGGLGGSGLGGGRGALLGGTLGLLLGDAAQADALVVRVHLLHLHPDDLALLHRVTRVGDAPVRQGGDVHQAVHARAQLHERAEGLKAHDLALHPIALLDLGERRLEGILLARAHGQRDALLLLGLVRRVGLAGLHAEDLHLHLVALTFTTSLGWATRMWDISETGIMPSTPPRSTNAPKSRTPVTLPLTILPTVERLARLGRQLLLLLLEQRAAREHHVAVTHLGDAEA